MAAKILGSTLLARRRSASPAGSGRITPLLPMGRPGEPREIAETILFLLSDMASYISGATLNVSGAR